MNVAELVLEYARVLVWPTAVLILVVKWRKPVNELVQRISKDATSVSGAGFSVELGTRLENLAHSGGLALSPTGSVTAEHAANVHGAVPLTADPVKTILDSYDNARVSAIASLRQLHPERDFNVVRTLGEAMEQYRTLRGTLDGALASVTAELQSIRDDIVEIDRPLHAFSPKERVYATQYGAVADRVIEHFRLLVGEDR